jgi:integrase
VARRETGANNDEDEGKCTNASVAGLPYTAVTRASEASAGSVPREHIPFASAAGTPINPRNLIRQFKGLLEGAKLRAIRFHDLRHTTATFLIARGEHPRTVMDILGHSQISTTLNTYGHILDETRTEAKSLG